MDEEQRDAARELQEYMEQLATAIGTTMTEFVARWQPAVESAGQVAIRYFEQNRPIFEELARIAVLPEIRAYVKAHEQASPVQLRSVGCYCLCGVSHGDRPGICTGEATSTISRWFRASGTSMTGGTDVPVCDPCHAAVVSAAGRA